MHGKYLKYCLTHDECLINISYYYLKVGGGQLSLQFQSSGKYL